MDKFFAKNVRILRDEVYYGDVKAEKFSFYIKDPNSNYAYDLAGNKFEANDYLIRIGNQQKPLARLFSGTETKTAFYFFNTNLKPFYTCLAAPLIPQTLKLAYANVQDNGKFSSNSTKLKYFKGKIPDDFAYSLETLRGVENELNAFARSNLKLKNGNEK